MTSEYLTLPKRTEAEVRATRDALSVAVAWKQIIWNQAPWDEDKRIDRLVNVCTKLCDGDRAKGKQLASDAIWSP